jgi:hypothetical protein
MVLGVVWILLFSLGVTTAVECQFSVPGFNSTGCYHYDLSKASGKTYNIMGSTNSSYVVSVCGNVQDPPKECNGKPPAPAYQVYEGSSCYVLGFLNETLMVCIKLSFHYY